MGVVAELGAPIIGLAETASSITRLLSAMSRKLPDSIDEATLLEPADEFRSYETLLKTVRSILERQDSLTAIEVLTFQYSLANDMLQSVERMLHKQEAGLLSPTAELATRSTILKSPGFQRKINKIKRDLQAQIIEIAHLLSQTQRNSQLADLSNALEPPEGNAQDSQIVILVLGLTGAGKSQFIREVTGSVGAVVGHGLKSETRTVKPHSTIINGHAITLVDTPGFDDTYRESSEIIREIADWLAILHQSKQKLTGLIYMQPITENRMKISMKRDLNFIVRMIDADDIPNLILVTSMWDRLDLEREGVAREKGLRQRIWAPLIERGAVTSRFYGNRASALQTIELIVSSKRPSLKSPLVVWDEPADDGKTLGETAAGLTLRAEMLRMQQRYSEELANVRRIFQQDTTRMRTEIDALRVELKRLTDTLTQKDRQKLEARAGSDRVQGIETAQTSENMESSRIHDTPSPSNEQVERLSDRLWRRLLNVLTWVRIETYRAVRPKLQEGMTRLEWTCSCGDLLYGDFKAATPGSLSILATRLGAIILAGPAGTNTSSTVPQSPNLPSLAVLAGATPLSPARVSGSPLNAGPFGSQTSQTSGAISVRTPSPATVNKRYLELCTNAFSGFHKLGEIDVSSSHSVPLSDRITFERIKAQYEKDRTVVRVLGHFAVHRPQCGNFVKFRTDRRPLVAVQSSGPKVPPADEVQSGRYTYNPVPIDEPPMPPQAFMHFFNKTTKAHNEAMWVTRFPNKLGDSIFYQSKPLEVGWGIEIEEVRNWWLFGVSQLIALLSSGAVAAVYAIFQKDIPSGIAIGAWLTAVQSLVVVLLFFRWA